MGVSSFLNTTSSLSHHHNITQQTDKAIFQRHLGRLDIKLFEMLEIAGNCTIAELMGDCKRSIR